MSQGEQREEKAFEALIVDALRRVDREDLCIDDIREPNETELAALELLGEDFVDRLVSGLGRQRLDLPGIFGVFYYRSANPNTLATLQKFLPVPAEALTKEFAAGATAEDICARTIRGLRSVGVEHIYVSNLPVGRARQTLENVLAKL